MKISHIFLSLLIIAFCSCQKNVITKRHTLKLVPDKELLELSLSNYKDFLQDNKPLPDDDSSVILVRKVGLKLQKAVEQLYKEKGLSDELIGYDWTFNVVPYDSIANAWCMPGGKVVVYSGLLPITKDENGLAVVLGHEISHALARHGNARMSEALVVNFGQKVLSVALITSPKLINKYFYQAYNIQTNLALLQFSRNDEKEADRMGLILMAKAGYNPEKAIDFWGEMSKVPAKKELFFLRTHPSNNKRIKSIKKNMSTAKKYYQVQSIK